MGAVLDQHDALLVGELAERVHLGRLAPEVGDADRLGLGGDVGASRGRVHQPGVGMDVRPGGVGVLPQRPDRMELHQRVAEHFVSRARPGREDRGDQQGHGRVGGDGMLHPEGLGKGLLQLALVAVSTPGECAAVKDVLQVLEFLPVKTVNAHRCGLPCRRSYLRMTGTRPASISAISSVNVWNFTPYSCRAIANNSWSRRRDSPSSAPTHCT